jgi:hypothetical protein
MFWLLLLLLLLRFYQITQVGPWPVRSQEEAAHRRGQA